MRTSPYVRATGIDLADVEEIRSALAVFGEEYLARVFTEAERSCGWGHPGSPGHLSVHFAAKEATFKALGADGAQPPWTSVELTGCGTRRYGLRLAGKAAELARQRGASALSVTVAHGITCALVMVVALGPPANFRPVLAGTLPTEPNR